LGFFRVHSAVSEASFAERQMNVYRYCVMLSALNFRLADRDIIVFEKISIL